MKLKTLLFATLVGGATFTNFAQDSTALAVEEPTSIFAQTPITSDLELLSFTLETWVFIPASVPVATGNSTDELFFIETYGTGTGGFVLRRGTTGQIRAYSIGGSGQSTLLGNTMIGHGDWMHVAATYDETEDSMRVFLNGIEDGALFVDQTPASYSSLLKIGARGDDSDINYAYKMDEVRIWDHARSEAEIAGDMNNCLTGNESGLVLYYTFEDVTVNAVTDGTGNGHTATIQNFATFALQDGVFDCCMIDNGVTANAGTLTANQAGATYQWVDCNLFAPIAGATNQSYTPTSDGDYAVIVDDGTCVDSSACVNVSGVGINEKTSPAINVYPNPVEQNLTIDAYGANIIEAKLISLSGQVIRVANGDQLDFIGLDAGYYLLSIQTDDGITNMKIEKK